MTITKFQTKISSMVIFVGATLTILSAANFPANAAPVRLTGDKGNYTIDYAAGTYQGCVNEKCIFLGSDYKVGESTWKNGEYKYVVGEE